MIKQTLVCDGCRNETVLTESSARSSVTVNSCCFDLCRGCTDKLLASIGYKISNVAGQALQFVKIESP